MAYNQIELSSYLDLIGYKVTTKTDVPDAYGLTAGQWNQINGELPDKQHVAIVLDRANSPTEILGTSWGSRARELQKLRDNQSLWSTYGAKPDDYDTALSILRDELGLKILDPANSTYTSSADSRTIWVELKTADDFYKLFNTRPWLMNGASTYGQDQLFWNGYLSIDNRINLSGLWFDSQFLYAPVPVDFSEGVQYNPSQGHQSEGNGSPSPSSFKPRSIAELYQFPLIDRPEILSGSTLGFIQPTIGGSVNPALQKDLKQLLVDFSPNFTGEVTEVGDSRYAYGINEERDLDVSISASINPTTNLRLYSGAVPTSETGIYKFSSTYGSLHAAAWDQDEMRPSIISNSYDDSYFARPDSPFLRAYRQLFEDLALQDVTLVSASGDHGSNADVSVQQAGNEISLGNGLANVQQFNANGYGLVVGGSSLSTKSAAQSDSTLISIYEAARANDRSVLWKLIQGGLKNPWSELNSYDRFLETVMNIYNVVNSEIYHFLSEGASAGGVDPTQPVPRYQLNYGLVPTTDAPAPEVGRGMPDVAANGGGNFKYQYINSEDAEAITDGAGTSASAPVWASLLHQINAILKDQNPEIGGLGYMNDLLYAASAVAPAAFNDITYGEIKSSFYLNEQGPYTFQQDGQRYNFITKPYGYEAAAGYDLASGLGTPNGILLTRAISTVVHAELSSLNLPKVLSLSDRNNWTNLADQSLLFQPVANQGGQWQIRIDETVLSDAAEIADPYGWTTRLAQQSLQPDFSSELAVLFDRQSLGQVFQTDVNTGSLLELNLEQSSGQVAQAEFTAPYGFIDFSYANTQPQIDGPASKMRVARPIAQAITAGNQNNQEAIVRMRQVGSNELWLRLYRVDDLTGMINGVAPGDPEYEQAVASRLYQTTDGASAISGGGYGMYSEDRIQGVNNGDLIAMSLQTSEGNTFYAFSEANEQVDGRQVAHVRNFGLNTWGWEDQYGGGDLDFNDLVAGLDFLSLAGSELLA